MVIKEIDGVAVNFTGEYYTVIIKQHDAPGVAAYITACFANHAVNIAFMRIYRDNKGEQAYTVVETDEAHSPGLIEQLKKGTNILSVRPIIPV